jgi:hypothetical protein
VPKVHRPENNAPGTATAPLCGPVYAERYLGRRDSHYQNVISLCGGWVGALNYFKSYRGHQFVRRRSLPAYEAAAITLYAARGRLIPFSANSPTGSTFTAFSTFVSTRGLMRICPGFASSHRRDATLDTVPMAA